jgi:hypothetical protein
MKYLLMDYVQEHEGNAGLVKFTPPEQKLWLGAYQAYMQAMANAGILRTSIGLQATATATTVRMVNDKSQVLDGPYADTKEQLGGFHIIDVADLDAALIWAARSPTCRYGAVEVRPLRDMSIAEWIASLDEPETPPQKVS